MGLDVRDANHDAACGGAGRRRALLDDDHRGIADANLHPMIPNAQTFVKAERTAQPIGCGANISIGQLRDDRAGRHGAIGNHGSPSVRVA